MNTLTKTTGLQENIGVVDRTMRMIAGSALIIPLAISMASISSVLMAGLPFVLIVSFYLLVTGMVGWDPLYAVLSYLLD